MNIKLFQEYIDEMKRYEDLDKGCIIDVLNSYVNGSNFLEHLDDFLNMRGSNEQDSGVIFSNEMDKDDDEYFGENKVMFFYDQGDDDYDVADYEECYKYLEATANFYIKHHEKEKEVVINLLKQIKERYII